MAASELTVRKRVTEILNACAAGTYSEAVDINYFDRNSLAIRQAVKEAALHIAQAIVVNPDHVHRNAFVSATPTALTHSSELPDMAGEPTVIEIQPYSGADWQSGVPRDVDQIESFRANPSNLYSALSHTTQNSPLGGYYAMLNGRIYFTGYACRAYFPVISDATVTTLIPEEYEGTWVALAVGKTVKEGDNLFDIAQYYYQNGINDLTLITQMGSVLPLPNLVEQATQSRGE